MVSIAKKAYEECKVGAHGTMRPRGSDRAALEEFQQEVRIAEQLERSGRIVIQMRHSEAQTGRDYIDLIAFARIE